MTGLQEFVRIRHTRGGVAQFQPEADRPLAEVRALFMYAVYFAQSIRNGKIYVGSTSKDPSVRIKEHNESSNEWSRNNKPLELVYYETFICKEDASKREVFYKSGMGRRIKKAIIRELKSTS